MYQTLYSTAFHWAVSHRASSNQETEKRTPPHNGRSLSVTAKKPGYREGIIAAIFINNLCKAVLLKLKMLRLSDLIIPLFST